MKLSKAILRGCKIRPNQSFGQLLGDEASACALGAALCTLPDFHVEDEDSTRIQKMTRAWPELENCDEIEGIQSGGRCLYGAIIDLNDIDRLTRQEIATRLAKAGY